jgi:anaerobic selenocysteine-containing dehydrogenase
MIPTAELIVIDPRPFGIPLNDQIFNLPIRPGRDAMLLKAMIRIVLDNKTGQEYRIY